MTTTEILKGRLENKPGVIGASIILNSGTYFDFLAPSVTMIKIQDIAWGLSNTCRFGGQCLDYYSVAQHSVLVSRMVPRELAFAALMHDAAEAYIGDMVGPLKQLCPDFKAIEKRVEAVIAERFLLPATLPPEIKHADLRALRTEQRDITSGSGDQWNGLDDYPPHPEQITPMAPGLAYMTFLREFSELWDDHLARATAPADGGDD